MPCCAPPSARGSVRRMPTARLGASKANAAASPLLPLRACCVFFAGLSVVVQLRSPSPLWGGWPSGLGAAKDRRSGGGVRWGDRTWDLITKSKTMLLGEIDAPPTSLRPELRSVLARPPSPQGGGRTPP